MRTRMHAVRLLLLAALVIACLGEFTDPPLVETPQTRSDPEALLSSLASLSTSGVAYGVASWEREATRHASAAPASHAAGSKHEPAAAQRSEHDQQYEKAGQPLQPPHKALFPLGTRDLATLLLTIITLFIAAGGGIGGGAVFIVCYVFVGGEIHAALAACVPCAALYACMVQLRSWSVLSQDSSASTQLRATGPRQIPSTHRAPQRHSCKPIRHPRSTPTALLAPSPSPRLALQHPTTACPSPALACAAPAVLQASRLLRQLRSAT